MLADAALTPWRKNPAVDARGPAVTWIGFIVRVARTPRELEGIVERVQTGEKHRFKGGDELCRIIERIVSGELAPKAES